MKYRDDLADFRIPHLKRNLNLNVRLATPVDEHIRAVEVGASSMERGVVRAANGRPRGGFVRWQCRELFRKVQERGPYKHAVHA